MADEHVPDEVMRLAQDALQFSSADVPTVRSVARALMEAERRGIEKAAKAAETLYGPDEGSYVQGAASGIAAAIRAIPSTIGDRT